MPNIDDVVRIAGVHRSTVARVFSRSGSVSPGCRKKVLAAARKINYHVNTMAQALKSRKKTALGFISYWYASPKPTEIYYQQTLTGIIEGMTHSKFLLVSKNIQGVFNKKSTDLNFLHESMLGGVIVLSHHMNPKDLTFLKRVEIPVLFLYYRTEDSSVSWVDMDNAKGARMVTDHLIGLGHRKIAFIGAEPENSTNARDRYEGYQTALKNAGILKNPELVKLGRFHFDFGKESAGPLLNMPKGSRPTAVFCATDMIAFGFIQKAREMGAKIPEQISIAGFDNYEQSALGAPPLTTIHQPFFEIGRKSVETLISIVQDPEHKPQQILIEPQLIVRSSTAPPTDAYI